MPDLTDTERAMLMLEDGWWKYAGAKDAAIRAAFDLSPTVYYQRLNALINRPEALVTEPMVVRRLLRLREARRRVRTAG